MARGGIEIVFMNKVRLFIIYIFPLVFLMHGFGVEVALAQDTVISDAVEQTYASGEIQTSLPEKITRERSETPNWLLRFLEAIGNVLEAVGPVLEILFYILLIGIVVWIFYYLVENFDWSGGLPKKNEKGKIVRRVDASSREKVKKNKHYALNDADAQATNGNYAEAVHILLIVSIDFINRKLKGFLSVSETSREILGNEKVSDNDRGLISHIVKKVEMSLFAGALIDKTEYEYCRKKFLELTSNEKGQTS